MWFRFLWALGRNIWATVEIYCFGQVRHQIGEPPIVLQGVLKVAGLIHQKTDQFTAILWVLTLLTHISGNFGVGAAWSWLVLLVPPPARSRVGHIVWSWLPSWGPPYPTFTTQKRGNWMTGFNTKGTPTPNCKTPESRDAFLRSSASLCAWPMVLTWSSGPQWSPSLKSRSSQILFKPCLCTAGASLSNTRT